MAQDTAPTTEPSATPVRSLESKFDLREKTDTMVAKYDKDPIGRIAGEMGTVKGMLGELNTNDPTQPKQQDIIAGLDELIAMLEKQKKNLKTGNALNPSNPMPDSALTKGRGAPEDLHDTTASARLWGQLSPKQREQILQSQNEGFPPGYETILSSYYKRLGARRMSKALRIRACRRPSPRHRDEPFADVMPILRIRALRSPHSGHRAGRRCSESRRHARRRQSAQLRRQ